MRLNSLTANFPEFHDIAFRDGLNVILANRTKEATKTDSRNGLGKTTAIALIDFCLGANLSDRTRQMQGRGWSFTLSLTSRSGSTVQVTRSPDAPGELLLEGDVANAGVADGADQLPSGEFVVGQRRWTDWLGSQAFARPGMDAAPPTFRSLMRHLARYRTDSLIDPFRTLANQRSEAVQAENAYFLNLDWRLAQEWASLKEQKARIALVDDPESPLEARVAALEPQLARAQHRMEQLRREVDSFSVLPEYRLIETRVEELSRRIKTLTNENIADRQMLAMYESQIRDEFLDADPRIGELFAEAQVALGEAIVRSLEEAAEFQRQVAANRAVYLAEESRLIRERIERRSATQADLASRNEADLRLLRSGGALDDFVELQQRLADEQSKIAGISEQLRTLRELGHVKARLKSEEVGLTARTSLDLAERFEHRAEIIARFGEIMEMLYGEPADLRIALGKGGFQFKTVLPRTGSGGVHLMAILAYDVAISEALARNDRGPGFLLHDSTVFADVDERQTARALEIGAGSAAEYGYQYIVALNSDKVPWAEFGDPSTVTDSVVLELHDGDPSGGLLGQRITSAPESSDSV